MACRTLIIALFLAFAAGNAQVNLDTVCISDYADTVLKAYGVGGGQIDSSFGSYYDSIYSTGNCAVDSIWVRVNLGIFKVPVLFVTITKLDSCRLNTILNPLLRNFIPDSIIDPVAAMLPETTDICSAISVEQVAAVQSVNMLSAASAPNPFQANTLIAYSAPGTHQIHLAVYDLNGRLVRPFNIIAGTGKVAWNGYDQWGRQVSAGKYICTLRSNGQMRSILLSKMQ